MKKILLSAALVWAGLAAQAQCSPVATLNEDFSNFTIATTNAFPQNCWTSIAGGQMGPLVYTAQAGTPANQYATIYSLFGVNTAAYLVSPELSTFDGNHKLSFSAWKLAGGSGGEIPAGNVTLQPGTLTNPTDASTFVAFGSPITITADVANLTDLALPASTTAKHIAFKFLADANHNAIGIDNVVWEAEDTPTPTCEAVATINESFSNFTIATSGAFPQNCWEAIPGGQTGPLVYTAQAGTPTNQYATFYAGLGVNVNAYLVTPEVSTLDGNHQLSFSTWKLAGQGGAIPAGNVTIQVGTITNTADVTTFTAVGAPIVVTTGTAEIHDELVFPASETNKQIAFRISSDAVHNAIAIDDVSWTEVPATEPVCEAVTEIDEDFTTFATEDFPFNCWSAIANGTMLYIPAVEGNQRAGFYSSTAANTPAYIIAPEVSNIDGAHTLSFDANGTAAGAVVLQTGYMTNAADAATFVAVGSPITLAPAQSPYSVTYPAISGNAHPAFQFTAPGVHQTAAIDNVKWQTTASVITNAKKVFSVYPNPSSDKNITLANTTQQDGVVAIYNLAGAKVFESKVSGAAQQLNLSALAGGMYVVKFTAGNATATQKLILQ